MFQLLVMAQLYLKKAVCKVLGSIVEHLSYNNIQDLNIVFDNDITFEADRHSGILKTSSSNDDVLGLFCSQWNPKSRLTMILCF